MDWLKSLNASMWVVVGGLGSLALLAVFGIPLGHWVWDWVAAGNNALVLIALALVGGVAGWLHTHNAA